MKKITIILPKHYNNGLRIDPEINGQALFQIRSIAGGYTKFDAIGAYTGKNGELMEDRNQVIMAVVADGLVEPLRKLAKHLCGLFDQECIYFEVSDCDVDFVC